MNEWEYGLQNVKDAFATLLEILAEKGILTASDVKNIISGD